MDLVNRIAPPEAPTPRPINTELVYGPGPDGGEATLVIRHWARRDALACRRCLECVAQPTDIVAVSRGRLTRVLSCTVAVAGVVSPDDAPLFSPDGLA